MNPKRLLLAMMAIGLGSSLGFASIMISSTLDGVRVYPNPWRADQHAGAVTFDQLPSMTTVKIFTLSGMFVKALDADAGSATWDLTNDAGDKVASGIYFYVLLTDDGQEFKGKLAVIK